MCSRSLSSNRVDARDTGSRTSSISPIVPTRDSLLPSHYENRFICEPLLKAAFIRRFSGPRDKRHDREQIPSLVFSAYVLGEIDRVRWCCRLLSQVQGFSGEFRRCRAENKYLHIIIKAVKGGRVHGTNRVFC
jgi:hypothetical protein